MKPSSSKSIKPPTLDGETLWPNYRRQFEAAAECHGHWSNGEKATALILALRGKALAILPNIPMYKQKHYAAVIAAFETRFGIHHLQQVYMNHLKTRIQHPTATLQEYGADIERLVRFAYPDAPEQFAHQLGVSSFIYGVHDIQLQEALRLGRYADVKDALIYALVYEATQSVNRQERNTYPIEL